MDEDNAQGLWSEPIFPKFGSCAAAHRVQLELAVLALWLLGVIWTVNMVFSFSFSFLCLLKLQTNVATWLASVPTCESTMKAPKPSQEPFMERMTVARMQKVTEKGVVCFESQLADL